MDYELTLGARHLGGGRTSFRVWAPDRERVDLDVVAPAARLVGMDRDELGYWQATLDAAGPGCRYYYRLDGARRLPDPASRYQPDVHGPSEVVDVAGEWEPGGWSAPALTDCVFYELHVGAFSPDGTFDGVAAHLDHLKRLGVTALELMPVAQFPGGRNWGYDGVYPFAVQVSYGGPDGLRRLVAACHGQGLAVVLDVVYNHLGPEGNYLREYGPYFTERYKTPWGAALNFDGPGSDEVRRFFIESALYYVRDLHVDAFRLDAVHAIVDPTAYPFVEELADAVKAEGRRQGREVYVIAESSLNDPRLTHTKETGGWGLDAVWSDDFHHAVHTLLTGEDDGYYADFGAPEQLEKALREGFAYTGEHSRFRGRRHGRSAADLPPERFVVAVQTHDQVGNRAFGERLSQIVAPEAMKAAAALLLLSPYLPLLFMGEEYADPAPFPYFISHSDPALIEAVRRGRREEFSRFAWQAEPPDPQSEATFETARLDLTLAAAGEHRARFDYYAALIELRRSLLARGRPAVSRPADRVFRLDYGHGDVAAVALFNLSAAPEDVTLGGTGSWQLLLDSADMTWGGGGATLPERLAGTAKVRLPPYGVAVYERARD